MKAAAELVVHTAFRHLAQGEQGHVAGFLVAGAMEVAKEEVENDGPRKLGHAAETAVGGIEAAPQGLGAGVEGVRIERRRRVAGRSMAIQLAENAAGGSD